MNQANKQQNALKILLIAQTIALLIYTIYIVQKEGLTLFQVFTNDIISITWAGQFNLDFTCYLIISGLWIMWRNKFTLKAILFSIVAMIMGFIVFAPYLVYLLTIEKANIVKVLIGDRNI
jgi:hypothetical protein